MINRHPRQAARKSLRFESLEDRRLMAGFQYTDFSDVSGLNVIGSAFVTNSNQLRLTSGEFASHHSNTGGLWYGAEKSLVAGGFETTFQFRLSTGTGSGNGSANDGFAFFIQNNSPYEFRGSGGGLGYGGGWLHSDGTPDGMPNSIAVEFDVALNSDLNDPSASHISVHTNGTLRR